MVGDRILALTAILLIIYGGAVARAYMGIAVALASFIGYSNVLVTALYPKLLAGGGEKDIETSFKLILMFSVPATIGLVVLADPMLTLFNPVYAVAVPVLLATVAYVFIGSFSAVLDSVIVGTETVDTREFTIKDLVKSKIFLLSSLKTYFQAVLYLPSLYIALTMIAKNPLEAAFYNAVIYLVVGALTVAIEYKVAKSSVKFHFPIESFTKYLFASMVMAVVISQISITSAKLSCVVPIVLLAIVLYFSVLSLIDKETRALLRAIIQQIGVRRI